MMPQTEYKEKELLRNTALKSLNNSVSYMDTKLKQAIKDTDGDGVIDSLDCDKNNKKKQGIFHDAINRIQTDRKLKKEARDSVNRGEIKSEKELEKKFTEESKYKQVALDRLRKLEKQKAYQKAFHTATLTEVKKKARARAKAMYQPPKTNLDPFTSSVFLPNPKTPTKKKPKQKKKTETSTNNFNDMMWRL